MWEKWQEALSSPIHARAECPLGRSDPGYGLAHLRQRFVLRSHSCPSIGSATVTTISFSCHRAWRFGCSRPYAGLGRDEHWATSIASPGFKPPARCNFVRALEIASKLISGSNIEQLAKSKQQRADKTTRTIRPSLQACIASLPLQSSLMSKTYLKSDHFNGGGARERWEFGAYAAA